MNTLLLQPTDVLFFRDGRPMGGASAGHGAAWPLPTVTDAALHAALHRSALKGHRHDQMHRGERAQKDVRQFGSLVTAGPFPVQQTGMGDTPRWYFPRPLDLTGSTLAPSLLPVSLDGSSSLPAPLRFAMASTVAPSKESVPKGWLSQAAYEHYLSGTDAPPAEGECVDDRDFSDSEASIGIAIDPATGTTGRNDAAGKLYSAHYLRLRDNWRLGCFARTDEKIDGNAARRADLIAELFGPAHHIVVGGQQRVCTATRTNGSVRLPRGLSEAATFHPLPNGNVAVKWVLLSPSLWPAIPGRSKDGREMNAHPGGWLPNWVSLDWDLSNHCARTSDRNGDVLLRFRSDARRRDYSGPKAKRIADHDEAISARLVAAVVPKALVVTGWALPNDIDRPEGGAKSTHLAVPAGAVYYFETYANRELGTSAGQEAAKLAAALNWHGAVVGDASKDYTTIKNRRSTLLGEKGFGLGVCGTWQFREETSP